MRKLINKMKEYLPIGEGDSEWVKGVGIPVMNFHADFCEKLEQTLETGYSVQSEVIGEFAQKSCKNVLDSSGYTKERNDLRQILTDLTLITGKNYTDLTTKGGIKGAIDKDISELREQQKENEKANVSPVERIKAKLQELSAMIKNLESEKAAIENEKRQLLGTLDEKEQMIKSLEEDLSDIKGQMDKTSEKNRREIAKLEETNKSQQSRIDKLEQTETSLQDRIRLLEQTETSLQDQLTQSEQDNKSLQTQLTQLSERHQKEIESERNAAQAQADALNKRFRDETTQYQQTLDHLSAQLAQYQNVAAYQSRQRLHQPYSDD